ncbi:MAG TPA: class F sortase [Candidatus Saccharimonadales bacterium]|nr:class F sortase [Candidatus Saccharimonadales bacterium]
MRIARVQLYRALRGTVLAELAVCAGLAVTLALQKAPAQQGPAPSAAHVQTAALRKTVNAGVPARLKIPKISVDAALEKINLTSQRDLAAPVNPANAGWYEQGPRPGDSGNAIIDGHFGYKNHIPAVFDNLHALQPGDSIFVTDEAGVTTTFTVRTTQTFSPNDNAASVFHPQDGKEHLNLITCHGTWNESQKSYAGRLVVFADKQSTP